MLNGHGDDLHNYAYIQYNFSSNVYYGGCRPELIRILEKSLDNCVNNYPSPTAEELSVIASEHFGMKSNNFLFFNGATEAFYTIAHFFKGQTATIFGPTFAEYEGSCQVHDIDINWKFRDEFHQPIDTRVAYVCNPNNPDGQIVSAKDIEAFLIRNKETTLVVDEAYIEFTNTIQSVIRLCEEYVNLIVVRSLTKVFAIPGVRLGYVVSNAKMIADLSAKKMPWSVNALAIRAGEYIFEEYEHLSFYIIDLLQEMKSFLRNLSEIDWLEVYPTNTTYVLIRLKKGTASKLKDYLAREHRVLIRDATNFTGLKGECIRLSLQSEEVNGVLINALNEW
ncbi:MAG: aminotransferase class I/II-fold pyridoxal phosphate-dependent enzyme [Crocinitomicaceae bacterium]|nr:aminotransferase class I/II-fold pyridoxal phosphate-dependent enzyme [Crocinitomicaceae bacterium]